MMNIRTKENETEILFSSCDDHGTGVALLPEREDDLVTE